MVKMSCVRCWTTQGVAMCRGPGRNPWRAPLCWACELSHRHAGIIVSRENGPTPTRAETVRANVKMIELNANY